MPSFLVGFCSRRLFGVTTPQITRLRWNVFLEGIEWGKPSRAVFYQGKRHFQVSPHYSIGEAL
jgi:hypothetical protein